jgi:hypothetical protein
MTAPIDLDALRAVLSVLKYEAGTIPFDSRDYGPQREQDVADIEAAHRTVQLALTELTTRRARDAETHNAMAMALQHIRLFAPDPTVDAALDAALLPFQRSDDKGDAT